MIDGEQERGSPPSFAVGGDGSIVSGRSPAKSCRKPSAALRLPIAIQANAAVERIRKRNCTGVITTNARILKSSWAKAAVSTPAPTNIAVRGTQ